MNKEWTKLTTDRLIEYVRADLYFATTYKGNVVYGILVPHEDYSLNEVAVCLAPVGDVVDLATLSNSVTLDKTSPSDFSVSLLFPVAWRADWPHWSAVAPEAWEAYRRGTRRPSRTDRPPVTVVRHFHTAAMPPEIWETFKNAGSFVRDGVGSYYMGVFLEDAARSPGSYDEDEVVRIVKLEEWFKLHGARDGEKVFVEHT